jgi:hypothetical protein
MSMDTPMPDFTAALEERLRSAAAAAPAVTARTRSARGTRHRRRIVLAAATLVLAVAATVAGLSASDDDGTGPHLTRSPAAAYGRPLILATPSIAPPKGLHEGGLAMTMILGAGARFTQAWPIRVRGGIAYVAQAGDAGYCLSTPDPAADDPDVERGVTCMKTADFLRFGIALVVGPNVLAAIPQGVRSPTLTLRDGTVRTLVPDAHGVVATGDAEAGSELTFYAPDGARRSVRLH